MSMQFTKSQNQIIKLARTPVKGCSLDVVQIHEYGKGLTTALKYIERTSLNSSNLNMPVSVILDAAGKSAAVRSLAKKAGLQSAGQGYFDMIERCISHLSQGGKRDVAIWLEEAREMKPCEREFFFAHCAYVSEHLGHNLRVVMLIGRVMAWIPEHQKRMPVFPALGTRLVHKATVWDFEKAGLAEVEDTDDLDIARNSGGIHELGRKVS